jgi:Sec-independent protein translocase protein TatA
MGSVGLGEIVIIAAIVLIIFGPDRLPEIARKGAELIRKSRAATTELTSSLRDEYGDVIAPLNEVRQELKSVRRDLTAAATSIADETSSLAKDLEATIDPARGGSKTGAAEETVPTEGAESDAGEGDETGGGPPV